MRLSVVIPTWNRKALLELSLRGLLRTEADRADFEVIVVDDASTDGTAEQLGAAFGDAVRVVRRTRGERRPCNPGFARNVGIRAAAGEWIAFMDDDVLHLHDVILGTLVQVADPAVWGCTGPWLEERDMDNATRVGFRGDPSEAARMPRHFWWVCRRNTLEHIGGFDERFTDYGAEDEDIWNRLRRLHVGDRRITGQMAVGLYASRRVEGGVWSKEQNALQHRMAKEGPGVVRNDGVEWGKAE